MVNKREIFQKLQINQREIKKLGVKSLALFGSYAREEQTRDSDLDFLVEFSVKSFDSYMELKFFLEDLFQVSVDLVLVDSIKPRLKSFILKEAVYAQGL